MTDLKRYHGHKIKQLDQGKKIELKDREGTQTIIGKVAKLKRDGWKSWAMLVTIEKIIDDWEEDK